MSETLILFLPIIISIFILLYSKNSFFSLISGLISAAVVASHGELSAFFTVIVDSFTNVFYGNGSWKMWNVAIIIFLPLLTIISGMIQISGGLHGLVDFLERRIKDKKSAEFSIFVLGIVIYIDGYFNAVILGNVARSFAQSHKISRAKLSYIVDSTSAPICPLSPISSWGAAILGIIGGSISQAGLDISPSLLFFKMIPYQFFTFTVLLVIMMTIFTKFRVGKMVQLDEEFLNSGIDSSFDSNKSVDSEIRGRISNFLIPIVTLIVVTSLLVLIDGYRKVDSFDLVQIIAKSNIAMAMVYSALFSLFILFIKIHKKHDFKSIILHSSKPLIQTAKTITILIIAWAMINGIDKMGLGKHLVEIITTNDLSPALLPFVLFITASVISFASGTSWGTFFLLLPIAFSLGIAYNIDQTVIFMAASISGSIVGDNCSLISDTTIISASATQCKLDAHYKTQIPYALVAGLVTGAAMLAIGFTGSLLVAYATITAGLAVSYLLINFYHSFCITATEPSEVNPFETGS